MSEFISTVITSLMKERWQPLKINLKLGFFGIQIVKYTFYYEWSSAIYLGTTRDSGELLPDLNQAAVSIFSGMRLCPYRKNVGAGGTEQLNRLRNEPNAFLVTIPETPAGLSSSIRRSRLSSRDSCIAFLRSSLLEVR